MKNITTITRKGKTRVRTISKGHVKMKPGEGYMSALSRERSEAKENT